MLSIVNHLKILAEACKNNFQDMTGTPVAGVMVKRQQRMSERHHVAISVGFNASEARRHGCIVMGFQDESTAVLVAKAIAVHLGVELEDHLDALSLDVLSEFLNTVVGHTINGWQEQGFVATFDPPEVLRELELPTHQSLGADSYVVILSLSFGSIVFSVNFEDQSPEFAGKKVLVVDDSGVIRGILRKALEQLGLEVAEARDGDEAKEKHADFRPDLTTMDVVMPGIGGLDAIVDIRQQDPNAKFIVISSYAGKKEERVTAQTLGVTEILAKPVKVDQLVAAVKSALVP